MKQAKVPSEAEFKRLVAATGMGKYAARNRVAVMLSTMAGCALAKLRR